MAKLYEQSNIKLYEMLSELYCKLNPRYFPSPMTHVPPMKTRVPHYFNITTLNILIALRDADLAIFRV
ncbi:hypothetical protein A4A49_27445 [Nicotiana attenuata]|uniref:Uncharacterized protein n=1 Tax=Nicotiana attenuata TaxID=49451 RepID=A0A1J6KBN4_NICAT|nr:hypothetical protein A4A49_27445 [Nicotiana attenuata]